MSDQQAALLAQNAGGQGAGAGMAGMAGMAGGGGGEMNDAELASAYMKMQGGGQGGQQQAPPPQAPAVIPNMGQDIARQAQAAQGMASPMGQVMPGAQAAASSGMNAPNVSGAYQLFDRAKVGLLNGINNPNFAKGLSTAQGALAGPTRQQAAPTMPAAPGMHPGSPMQFQGFQGMPPALAQAMMRSRIL